MGSHFTELAIALMLDGFPRIYLPRRLATALQIVFHRAFHGWVDHGLHSVGWLPSGKSPSVLV